MEVAVIGGGIGGLTLALYLHRGGIPCRVYEAVPEFKPLGVGINLFPHAIRRLVELGLGESIARVGIEAREFAFFNQFGQLIYSEPCGRYAGYEFPHYSFHRADLHELLHDAVKTRIGADAVVMSRNCRGVDQDESRVTLRLEHTVSGEPLAPVRADAAVACDGFHSAVRRQFYPNEGRPSFGGINLWRGVTRGKPFLTGASVTRAGPLRTGKLVVYPVRNHPDGTQTLNWSCEVKKDSWAENDWNKRGRLEDFIGYYLDWHFDWLDVPDMLRRAEFVLEYPMVDRDPVERWSFGRVTLLGDAAHPMYPRGGNGGAQAILDAERLAQLLKASRDPTAAFQAYQADRLPKTTPIVLTNRTAPPDLIIETVDSITGGKPFRRIEDVIGRETLVEISEHYKHIAAWDIDSVNR
ncbi:MAG TPA: flavin-dependent oxidoreductase [Burkholderiales bacterium]|nr:flavin-dependent oxidoreductase [Burkholderiales bacterium]